jgi:phosphohistidine swiveling domain-containing protein
MVKQRKDAEALEKETEGNALIAKLRQQTQDNKERNDSLVMAKTLENDLVSFLFRSLPLVYDVACTCHL